MNKKRINNTSFFAQLEVAVASIQHFFFFWGGGRSQLIRCITKPIVKYGIDTFFNQ